jgi:hypothetical protein
MNCLLLQLAEQSLLLLGFWPSSSRLVVRCYSSRCILIFIDVLLWVAGDCMGLAGRPGYRDDTKGFPVGTEPPDSYVLYD